MIWGKETAKNDPTGKHQYIVYAPQDLEKWLDAVASEYIVLRGASQIKHQQPLPIAGVGVFSVEEIQKKIASACVPQADLHKGNLSVSRSDLSEVASYMLLEHKYKTQIGSKLIKDRELIQLPGRGIDSIGIEAGDKLVVVLSEVKFSSENSKPKAPQVVDKSSDSMRNQHLSHLANKQVTISKLYDCSRKCNDAGLRDSYITAAVYLEKEKWDLLDIVSCNVLVRPNDMHSDGDFGTFAESPNDFVPARIRFLVIALPASINTTLNAWVSATDEKKITL